MRKDVPPSANRAVPDVRRPAYRRIADELRHQIQGGTLAPGDQLPSEGQLVATWKSSSFTIHTALQTLIREGWIESIRGAGTYVSKPDNRFVCAGIYHSADICSEEETPFARRVHVALLDQFRRLKKETLVFMDTRPKKAQTVVLPALAEAVLNRRIQCLVSPILNTINSDALNRLRLPMATLGSNSPASVNFNMEDFFARSVGHLAREGCRSIGLISTFTEEARPNSSGTFYELFHRALRKQGLKTQPAWVRKPQRYIPPVELERHGYLEFKNLWDLRLKPDGLIIYPDTSVRGALTAILEIGKPQVTQQMKFVFHRNGHLDFLCPLNAAWAVSDEGMVAKALIEQIQKQFRGEKVSPLLLPFGFTKETPEI